ncbi:hypothetical protein ACIGO9_30725 [Nocardia asteroides]|uniref:hypothetical protein n=1 Tax=Nocardia asteroides TaxID=1824 RepID=UPI0037C678C9
MIRTLIDVTANGNIPTERQHLDADVQALLTYLLGNFLWFVNLFAVASFMATVMMLVWQRRTASSYHLVEEAVLLRILIATAGAATAGTTASFLLNQ